MSAGGSTAPVRVALLGGGTVGAAVARLLLERADGYAARLGRPLELVGVAVRDASRLRDGIPAPLLTTDAGALVREADVVVEVMGGLEPARALVEQALRGGAQVVTANKQLIAQQGEELHAVAAEHGVGLDYEAAVMAAVPVLSVVREALAGDEITAVRGVVNGSTNYVLDLVAREGVPFADAVRQAGELGYLEADPTEDLEGLDAAAKIVILARTAWGADVTLEDVDRTGITGLTDDDFARAARADQVIKLVAGARRVAGGQPGAEPDRQPGGQTDRQPGGQTDRQPGGAAGVQVEVRVRPEALPADDPLAQVRGGTNVVVIDAVSAGQLRLQGAGAGGDETASAVLADLLRAAARV